MGGLWRETCAYGRPGTYIFFNFWEKNISNQSAKADLQISSLNYRLVPKGDPRNMNVSRDLRPGTDTQVFEIISLQMNFALVSY